MNLELSIIKLKSDLELAVKRIDHLSQTITDSEFRELVVKTNALLTAITYLELERKGN